MTAIRIQVTAAHIALAGPRSEAEMTGWRSPVELAIAAAAGVDVDVDGDDHGWHATIGTREGATLVVDLPEAVSERLDASWAHGIDMEPFEFALELDDWLVDFFRSTA